ncbi:tyrosine-type recombinase/integrase [Modestobacter sp. Leaf380]|uniref:tyrosine-type recombinase/integrase n=1 Tax=Modestobacter sp. Leaf380 TaxID=1736356 RepID=UPI0006FB177F|nr:tyrosine-type recombinase/integrase [Modestobacter sp. Leaf380]KQS63930.1 hypothetical protein ASG41_17470 [Modestobacter sp. Leaf380]
MASRAGFGAIDKMASGKWRARCTGPDGKRRSATFPSKSDARVWLATQQTDAVRRMWRAPEGARRTVDQFAGEYLQRQDLRDSTRVLYANLWRLHLADRWTGVEVGDVTPAMVRTWHTTAAATTGPAVLAQSYRLLRAVLGVAVADDAIAANPCKLRGASTPKAARPSRALTAAEATAVADHLGQSSRTERYSALVMVLTFGGLRFGEEAAFRRSDVLEGGNRLRIERAVRYYDGRWVVGEPKTEAGHRTVALPTSVRIALVRHMDRYVPDTADALVFGTRSGTFLSAANFGKTFRRAADAVGLGPVRPHELRHTGATLAAAAGASTKELMRRLGHASPDAALIYQHANDDRDAEIARALEARITPPQPPPSMARRSRSVNRPGPGR